MLGEPVLLGLLVAPSTSALGVTLAAVCAFLTRHPSRLVAADWRQGRRTPRTAAAARFALGYAGLAAAGLALAARGSSGFWLPLAAAAPLAFAQLAYDVRSKGRQLLPEVLGGVALGSVASAALLAGGSGLPAAAALWVLVAAAFGLLLARAVHGLSPFRRRVRPQAVGVTEVAYGLAFVVALAIGYRLGL